MVEPLLARLMDERQAAEALHQFVGWNRRQHRPGRDARVGHCLLDRIARGKHHHRAETEPEGQEVAQGDRPSGRHCILQRAFERAQDVAVSQLRQPAVDWIVQAEPAFLDQDHRRRGHDRLGQRGDAEDGVAPHRIAAADRFHADGIDMDLAAPAEQRDETRHLAARHMAEHDLAHVGEPRLGQSCGDHRWSPPVGRVAA